MSQDQYDFFRSLGLTGALQDMQKAFYTPGDGIDPVVTVASNGTATGIAAGGSVISRSAISSRIGTALLEPGNGVTPTTTAGAGCTIGSSGFVTENGEQWFQVTATAISGTNNYVEINIPTFEPITADSACFEYMTDGSQGTPVTLYLGTASFTKFATRSWTLAASDQTTPFHHNGRTAGFANANTWTKNGYTEDTRIVPWVQAKLRITITNGQTRTFKLRSLRIGVTKGKGRICVIADDGYASWIRLGVPILEHYGILTTSAIIANKINTTALYSNTSELRSYVSRGHECVAHGPISGTGTLIDDYTTNEERVTDVKFHRDTLQGLGLLTPYSRRCYVFPQGKYAPTAGDVSLLDALRAEGIVIGRSATPSSNTIQLRALSEDNHMRMVAPIIGHSYAGVANTADDATETTNINNIITAIQAAGTARTDIYLMLHKVVVRGGASAAIEIEADRLMTLAAAIRTEIDAGRLQSVLMSEMV